MTMSYKMQENIWLYRCLGILNPNVDPGLLQMVQERYLSPNKMWFEAESR